MKKIHGFDYIIETLNKFLKVETTNLGYVA